MYSTGFKLLFINQLLTKMSDYTCINCGSSKITQFKNSDFITSQPLVQKLIILKKQKEKQLKTNSNCFQNFNRFLKELKRNYMKEWLGYIFLVIIILILISPKFPLLFFITLSLIILLIIFFIPISIIIVLIVDSLKKLFKDKYRLYKINKKLNKCFTLYYCSDCNFVMDLEEKRYEKLKIQID